MKTLLMLVDGLRPDAMVGHPAIEKLMKKCQYTMEAKTVVPPVTLPCHMSLFHSTTPQRHGVTTNVYTPPVSPIKGLVDYLEQRKKFCAAFYSWEQLRDIARPGAFGYVRYMSTKPGYCVTDDISADEAIKYIADNQPDFMFLYFVAPDGVGHQSGWMSEEYIASVENALKNVDKVVDSLPEDYGFILTADHGGHDRMHGLEIPEDMTIPIFVKKAGEQEAKVMENASILDIAPTIASMQELEIPEEWEGKSLI
jgi:predicted AlkP superfamily pyrophosphatase or phosphodiesterase